MTKDIHKWTYDRTRKVFVKQQAMHINVPKAFAYSQKKLLQASSNKGTVYTVSDNGALLYTNEFPPHKLKRKRCSAKNNQHSSQKKSKHLLQPQMDLFNKV